jgi:hypothetical protein
MHGKAAYIKPKVVGLFSEPCTSGSYMHLSLNRKITLTAEQIIYCREITSNQQCIHNHNRSVFIGIENCYCSRFQSKWEIKRFVSIRCRKQDTGFSDLGVLPGSSKKPAHLEYCKHERTI